MDYVKETRTENIILLSAAIFTILFHYSSFLFKAITGGYCNLVFFALASKEAAYDVNSMFLIHSPFEGVEFLTYPVIALIVIPIYLAVFIICDLCAHKKGERFYNKK